MIRPAAEGSSEVAASATDDRAGAVDDRLSAGSAGSASSASSASGPGIARTPWTRTVRIRFRLDRFAFGALAACVPVFALLGVQEVSGERWGEVLSLAPYGPLLTALLVSTTVAKEFDQSTALFGLTQRFTRPAWLWWRIWPLLLASTLAGLGLGTVLGVVSARTPAAMNAYLDGAQRLGQHWQLPVADAVLACALATLAAVVARRVVPAVVSSSAAVIALGYLASQHRDAPVSGLAPATAAWVIVVAELVSAGAALGVAMLVLDRADA